MAGKGISKRKALFYLKRYIKGRLNKYEDEINDFYFTYSDGLYEMTVGNAFKLSVVSIKFEDRHCPHGFGAGIFVCAHVWDG